MKLGDIAIVRSGLVLSRKQARGRTENRYRLLNLRSINPDGYIEMEQLDVYDAVEPLRPEYLSQPGDVIVRLSIPYTAVLINDSTSGLVVSSNFAIIRIDPSVLVPEYLFWLLNTKDTKHEIYENTAGNMLGSVKPKYFTVFELDPPPLEDQKKIAAMYTLALRECQLLRKLAQKKEQYYTTLMDQMHKEMKRGSTK